ncbi:sensor histidine kinase [Promicromonospora kroppenstedtii]|uniref:sensor histidine kinase n=1 Tax=Promicromonospora kroppenstedtii TaxID=440482 RepID=UPI0004B83FE4|nr:histidine kinase [Promicromonospora kroppenstedtii]
MTDLRRALDRWRRLDVTVRDLPLALGFAGLAFLPFLREYGTQVGELPARPLDGWAVLVIALQCLPLAVRRRFPAVCMLLVAAGFAAAQVTGYHSFAGNALGVALVSTGAHLGRRRRVVPAVLTVAYVALAVVLDRLTGAERVDELVTFYLAMALAWGVGVWLRSTRAAEAERRRRVAQDTLVAERTRIARELHDVVTHHVTAMVVQTEAAKYLTAAPERMGRTLDAVTDTGRHAIADLRHLLDLLDPGHDGAARTPSAGEVRDLVEQTRRAGQPVELVEDGEPARSADSAGLTVYRVVQEALTNALKHAHGAPTAVDVRHTEREIVVEISTAGTGGSSGTAVPGGSGRGLAGLRERVVTLGGEFGTERLDDAGFVVRARVPRAYSTVADRT